jgi:hypothetical protein
MSYKVTLYSQRLAGILRGLRGEWDANRKYHHAQATGLTLAQIAMGKRRISEFLDVTLDYVVMRGIYGVDGILLSLMSAAQYLDPSRFSRAMGLCDTMSGSVNRPPKDGFGIYFFDFGVALHGQGLNQRAQNLLSSVSGLLSGFPDDVRDSLFNGGIENGFSPGTTFGGLVRGIGADEIENMSSPGKR